MALTKEAQIKALKALKYTDDQIKAIMDDDAEQDLTVPATLKIYDEPGYTELEKNIRAGAVKDYPEIWCRKMNKDHELGLTGDDAKDEIKVLAALKTKAAKEAGQTPSEWEGKFKELQGNFDKKDGEISTFKQQLEALQAEKKYRKLFWPEMSDALDDEEWISRLQKTFEIRKDGEIDGLWDKTTGKFIADDKLNTIPFGEAWTTLRATDRFKSWHKAKAAEVPKPDLKKTHDPANRNPATKVKKYQTEQDILKEVDRQFPPEKKNEIKGFLKVRMELGNKLRAEMA